MSEEKYSDIDYVGKGATIRFANFCVECRREHVSRGACYIHRGSSLCEDHFLDTVHLKEVNNQ